MGVTSIFGRKEKIPCSAAVVLAAGKSERMGSDKILADLAGIPVIVRTLLKFQKSDYISEIVVVTHETKINEISQLCSAYNLDKVSKVVSGGKSRTESAFLGVSAVNSKSKIISVHDGARPLVSDRIIKDVVCSAMKYMAAVPSIPVTDTVKIVDDNGIVNGSIDREHLFALQTPQAFDADVIKGALSSAVNKKLELTDDCSAVELLGGVIHTVPGDAENIKLTYPSDFLLAESIIKSNGGL